MILKLYLLLKKIKFVLVCLKKILIEELIKSGRCSKVPTGSIWTNLHGSISKLKLSHMELINLTLQFKMSPIYWVLILLCSIYWLQKMRKKSKNEVHFLWRKSMENTNLKIIKQIINYQKRFQNIYQSAKDYKAILIVKVQVKRNSSKIIKMTKYLPVKRYKLVHLVWYSWQI